MKTERHVESYCQQVAYYVEKIDGVKSLSKTPDNVNI